MDWTRKVNPVSYGHLPKNVPLELLAATKDNDGWTALHNAAQHGQKCSEEARPHFVAFSRWASCEITFTGKSTSNRRRALMETEISFRLH